MQSKRERAESGGHAEASPPAICRRLTGLKSQGPGRGGLDPTGHGIGTAGADYEAKWLCTQISRPRGRGPGAERIRGEFSLAEKFGVRSWPPCGLMQGLLPADTAHPHGMLRARDVGTRRAPILCCLNSFSGMRTLVNGMQAERSLLKSSERVEHLPENNCRPCEL